jgi:hypothetical protein
LKGDLLAGSGLLRREQEAKAESPTRTASFARPSSLRR